MPTCNPQTGATPTEAVTPGSAAAPTPVLSLTGGAPTTEMVGRRLMQVGGVMNDWAFWLSRLV